MAPGHVTDLGEKSRLRSSTSPSACSTTISTSRSLDCSPRCAESFSLAFFVNRAIATVYRHGTPRAIASLGLRTVR